MQKGKWSMLRSWDKVLSRFDSRDFGACVGLTAEILRRGTE
jgi:hypothetical protein